MKKILSFIGIIIFAIVLISCQEVDKTTHTINEVIEAISIEYAEGDSTLYVTENIVLPLSSELEKSAVISWDSNLPSVIDNFGTLNRQSDDTLVTLTLSVSLGSDSAQKFFDVTVAGTILRHTVSFDVNGDITTQRIIDGESVSIPIEPAFDALKFLGWFSDESLETPFDFESPITEDVMIYAGLETIIPGFYSVEIYLENLDDEAYTLLTTEHGSGEATETVEAAITREGFILNFELSTVSGVLSEEDDLALTTYFDRLNYTVNFYDGGNLLSSETFKYEQLITTIDDPTKDEYLFLGWSLSPVSETYYTFGQAITSNVTLYAQWEFSSSYTYEGYYEGAEGLTNNDLKLFLRTVVTTGFVGISYGDSRYILDDSDADPNNPSNVILVYRGTSISGVWDGGDTWNREHVWPQSLLNVSVTNSYIGVGSDLQNLKPANPSENSSRSNKYFDNITTGDSYAPRDEVKGDVARILFYMTIRYSNLNLVDSTNPSVYQMAMLSRLLEWHLEDPVDSFEQHRNDVIFSHQKNRNPFIDHPEFVEKLWGPITLSNDTAFFINVETSTYLVTNCYIIMPQEPKKSYIN